MYASPQRHIHAVTLCGQGDAASGGADVFVQRYGTGASTGVNRDITGGCADTLTTRLCGHRARNGGYRNGAGSLLLNPCDQYVADVLKGDLPGARVDQVIRLDIGFNRVGECPDTSCRSYPQYRVAGNDVDCAVCAVNKPTAVDLQIRQIGAAQFTEQDGLNGRQLQLTGARIEYRIASHGDTAAATFEQQVAACAGQVSRFVHCDTAGSVQCDGAAVSRDALRQPDAAARSDQNRIAQLRGNRAHNA